MKLLIFMKNIKSKHIIKRSIFMKKIVKQNLDIMI